MIELTGIPVIETERLRLRGPKASDFEVFAGCLASERSRFIGGPLDRNLAWRSFCHMTGHWVHRGYSTFVFADKATDAPYGMAGPWFPEGWPEREIGWTVWDAQAEGKGYAYEAALAARDWAYADLGWETAISLILPDNLRSQALAKRMGCGLDHAFEHATYGTMQVWRHPSPEALH
jgi:RimJ/RimL family protein N-acetyltransferase